MQSISKGDRTAPIGGEAAKRLRQYREDVLTRRRAALKERSEQPTVAEFYAGRNVFLTGGSGFIGRLTIEMLLRTCPDIGTIYLIVRSKKGVAPEQRLRCFLNVPLFDRLRAERPGALDKVVALPGDIMSLGLGLSEEHQQLLRREVSVVIHMAASVRFDEPFQKAVFTNLRSTREVVQLARGMAQLRAFVHVSTAYTNINREPVGEVVYQPHLDWWEVIHWAEELGEEKHIDFLGAKLIGFQPNKYTFTKALAEQLINDFADELPVIITRPSVVIGTLNDPLPGWIDNLYGFGAFWAGGCKGVIRVVHDAKGNPDYNTIPADMVTKSIILASWYRGCHSVSRLKGARQAGGADVVNVALGPQHGGISCSDMMWVSSEDGIGDVVPYPGILRPPKVTFPTNKISYKIQFLYHHLLFGFILDILARVAGVKPRLIDLYRKSEASIEMTAPFRKDIQFTVENQKTLQVMMHPNDEQHYCNLAWTFTRDTAQDFRKFSADTLRGILLHVLKEEDNPEKHLKFRRKLMWAMRAYHSLMALIFFFVSYNFIKFLINRFKITA